MPPRHFELVPFRGLRFDADQVGDLGTVISPPYDVLDADLVRDLEAGNRRNIVRLILSRRFERPYLAVRTRLEKWREKGYLRPDPEPALYLYEYQVDAHTVRGLIGLVGLREEHEQVVLPHEDVMPAPVEDRTVLMRTTATNLEPILLVHQGAPAVRDLLDQVAATAPLARFAAPDGSRHVLWSVTDPAVLADLAARLRDTQALIADGHHRYAAYLALQRELDHPAWDYGLAMLVDQSDHPLGIGPIHRSVAALTLADLQDLAGDLGHEFIGYPDRESVLADRHPEDPATTTFAVSDGRTWAAYRAPRTHELDAVVLHETLCPAWHVAEEQLGYHHSLDQAMSTTHRQPGLVIAMPAPSLEQVMAAAAAGVRMPRKSTSFQPKPRMGVVMRDLEDS